MAEGFAPSCTATIDAAITSVVTDYTLRGLSVLVHCRGGVGRAGLIACTWMLKMGLVGPPVDGAISISSGAHPPSGLPVADDSDAEGQKLLHTVERLIETIRRRRSPKAIETAEQVRGFQHILCDPSFDIRRPTF